MYAPRHTALADLHRHGDTVRDAYRAEWERASEGWTLCAIPRERPTVTVSRWADANDVANTAAPHQSETLAILQWAAASSFPHHVHPRDATPIERRDGVSLVRGYGHPPSDDDAVRAYREAMKRNDPDALALAPLTRRLRSRPDAFAFWLTLVRAHLCAVRMFWEYRAAAAIDWTTRTLYVRDGSFLPLLSDVIEGKAQQIGEARVCGRTYPAGRGSCREQK